MHLAVRRQGVTEPHRWTEIDDVMVSFTIPGPITDRRWDAFVDTIVARRPASCLLLCAGAANVDAAQKILAKRARLNGLASLGEYEPGMED